MKQQHFIVADVDVDKQSLPRNNLLIMDHRFQDAIAESLRASYTHEDLHDLATGLESDDIEQKHRKIIGIRKILSSNPSAPIQQAINEGLVPHLISFAKQKEYPHLRLEAAWTLTNILSGDIRQCQEVINRGGVFLFVKMLKAKKFKIVEQAIWGLGNIAATNIQCRDAIIRKGTINKIILFSKKFSSQRILKRCCWVLSNLLRGQPLPLHEQVKNGIVFICQILAKKKIKDEEIIGDCCWAISFHVRHIVQHKKDLLASLIPQMVILCNKPQLSIIVPLVRIFGELSFISGHTNDLITYGVLKVLKKFLKHRNKIIRKETCWVISNITAGTLEQVNAVIREQEMIKTLVSCFRSDSTDVRREICFIFSNLAYQGDPNIIYGIYEEYKIVRYYYMLFEKDTTTVEVVLKCLSMILAFANSFSISARLSLTKDLRVQGAPLLLEKLQCRQSDIVVNYAKILMAYFDQEMVRNVGCQTDRQLQLDTGILRLKKQS